MSFDCIFRLRMIFRFTSSAMYMDIATKNLYLSIILCYECQRVTLRWKNDCKKPLSISVIFKIQKPSNANDLTHWTTIFNFFPKSYKRLFLYAFGGNYVCWYLNDVTIGIKVHFYSSKCTKRVHDKHIEKK